MAEGDGVIVMGIISAMLFFLNFLFIWLICLRDYRARDRIKSLLAYARDQGRDVTLEDLRLQHPGTQSHDEILDAIMSSDFHQVDPATQEKYAHEVRENVEIYEAVHGETHPSKKGASHWARTRHWAQQKWYAGLDRMLGVGPSSSSSTHRRSTAGSLSSSTRGGSDVGYQKLPNGSSSTRRRRRRRTSAGAMFGVGGQVGGLSADVALH